MTRCLLLTLAALAFAPLCGCVVAIGAAAGAGGVLASQSGNLGADHLAMSDDGEATAAATPAVRRAPSPSVAQTPYPDPSGPEIAPGFEPPPAAKGHLGSEVLPPPTP